MRSRVVNYIWCSGGLSIFPLPSTLCMKKIFTILFLAAATQSGAQISITATDLPSAGDTLRYSRASPLSSGINTSLTGANFSWNFSSLTPVSQGIDSYRTALQVNPIYAFTISPSAFGYKVADSVPGFNPSTAPVQARNLYLFFSKKTSPARYVAEGGAITINGVPTAANYSDEDEWFFSPLQFGDVDSSTYSLTFSIASLGTYKQQGYRKTTVDGWGTITTPFATTPVQVLRVRSEIVGTDSVSGLGLNIAIPRNVVEYRWMASSQRYPLLYVTANRIGANEIITDVRYRDVARTITPVSIGAVPAVQEFAVYPNPARNSVALAVPAGWQQFSIRVYSNSGALVLSSANRTSLDVSSLAGGAYFIILEKGSERAVAKFQK